MRRIPNRLCYLISILFTLPLMGQSDTIISLDEVMVVAPGIRQDNLGSNSKNWNANKLQQSGAQNLGDLLSQESGVFIKSYGLGSLATNSVRGGSAGHTQVLWNGLPIQSPMLGLLDFALLPISFIDEVNLSRGGNTAQWGSGAIGGVISLNNQMDFAQQFSVTATSTLGSFGHFQQNLQMDVGHNNWFSSTRLLYLQAENDFSYPVAPTLPDRQQTNAAIEQQGLLQSLYFILPKHQSIATHLWLQSTDRQIPPTTTQNRSVAYEDDQAIRLVVDYTKYYQKGKTTIKFGFTREDLDYFDETNQLASLSHFNTWTGDLTHQYVLKKNHQILVGLTQLFTEAEADGYTHGRSENRTALFASYRWQRPKWKFQTSLRQTLADGEFVPTVPILALEGRLRNWLTFKAKISRNYRLPTLNDRFWQPGGNTELLPEQGWSEEVTLQGQWQHQNLFWNFSLTGFNRVIDDWILWSRPEGQQFWSSFNVAKVWSRGLEQRATVSYLTKQWEINLNLGYDYIRSTNQVGLELPRIEKGSQLWYTPEHQLSGQVQVRWNQFRWSYQYQWTGDYEGTIGSLSAFQTASTRIQFNIQHKKLSGQLFSQILNLWNEEYQVIERRPMPGRYYRIGLQIKVGK